MSTISITPAAFATIASILPKGSTVAGRPDDNEGYLVTLDRPAFDRLRAKRRPGESYSDVILRLAKGDLPTAAQRPVSPTTRQHGP